MGSESHRSYFEDVPTGVWLETPGMTLTPTHVTLLEGLAGPGAPSDPPAVPDLLALCVTSGLSWRVPQPPLVVLAFMGLDWQFHHRVLVGDTIRSRSRTAAKRPMRDGGIVFEERQVVNQRGEVVQSGKLTLLVARRPEA